MQQRRSGRSPRGTLEASLSRLAGQVGEVVPRTGGSILLRCSDSEEEYRIEGLGQAPRVTRQPGTGHSSVRVTGPASVIQEVLDGRLEASRAVTAGGIRVRGDLEYLESVLKSLKLLQCE